MRRISPHVACGGRRQCHHHIRLLVSSTSMRGSPSPFTRRTMQPFNAGRARTESPMRHESAHARPTSVVMLLICVACLCSAAPSHLTTPVHSLLCPLGVTAACTVAKRHVSNHSPPPNTPKSPSLSPATNMCQLSRPSREPSFELCASCADGLSFRGTPAAPTTAEHLVHDRHHPLMGCAWADSCRMGDSVPARPALKGCIVRLVKREGDSRIDVELTRRRM